ncbi:hypothetical protein DSM106972_064810 [Dulcicalothrix desertica PCC 7102]|uniref:Uncharacterized protein n=1 Tax=Dulcicalothrix desertica PCC 7102 TaxID=232991 RepID=A0A3S1AIV6_9CYAN|nr:hypothetical protein [Dulcicalothrix desertica]RUT01858.1 hypothetical protein DSM106972_064810 [Dulcicalothrix desertica PCC 7102]TWH43010.1 hypothetical protein CAL7102_06702 [Dulcicalothrix desertica PCC 7102]
MNLEEFKQALTNAQISLTSLPTPLKALYHDKIGNWDAAHEILEHAIDKNSAWVHAYLHRKEGDINNARYWYRRSGKPEFQGELDEECEHITTQLLLNIKRVI